MNEAPEYRRRVQEVSMSKGTKTGLIVLAIIAVLGFMAYSAFVGAYNNIVTMEEGVTAQWGQVQNVYQRRSDLIPNLVATVKGYASHEADVLESVTQARSRVGGTVTVSDDILNDPEAFKRYQQAQNELGGALQRLLMVTENYPELKANESFLALQDQLEGTENRITVERKRFNDAVRAYNTAIRRFPASLIANMGGFRTKAYFEADSNAQSAPQVSFE